jgi:hypothetical protein
MYVIAHDHVNHIKEPKGPIPTTIFSLLFSQNV